MKAAILAFVFGLFAASAPAPESTFVVMARDGQDIYLQSMTPTEIGVEQLSGAPVAKRDVLHCQPKADKVKAESDGQHFTVSFLELDCGAVHLAVRGIAWPR